MSDSDNTDEPLLEVNNGVTPDAEDKPNKPKKGKGAKLKDKFKRSQRLSAGDISAIAPDDATAAKHLEELKKKDIEKSVTDQKAFERKELVKQFGLDEEAKHGLYNKVERLNDKYKSSGFGQSVDRLGKNMKTVGQGAEAMTEAALLETALYNMLMLLFELLFGAKKGVKKLPEGAKWLNANRKRQHLYSGALRRYAKEDHGKALKEADGLKKEIDDLKKERADLKAEKKELEEKNKTPPVSDAVLKRYGEIDERLKANKAEIGEKQGKYDAAMLRMAKAENTFKQHGDATKNEQWQKAMTEYKELLPKLSEASEKYKADKKIVENTPLLQQDAKRAELKLDKQKEDLGALKKKESALYDQMKDLEKSIGKTSAELAEMKKASDKDHKDGMTKGRDRADKIAQVEELASQKIDSMKKGEGLVNTKEALQKEQKGIKEAQAELKKIPDKDKTPEEKSQKAALDKRAAEIKGKLTNLDGKAKTLDNAVNKAQAKMDNFTMLTQEQKDKKLQKDPNLETKLKDKLQNAKDNQAAYQKQGTDLTARKEQLNTKLEAYPNLPDGDKKKTPERLEKLQNNLARVTRQLDKYNAESSGQIAQNKQATDNIQGNIVNLSKQLDSVKPPKPTADTPLVSVTNPGPNVTPTTPVPDQPRQRAQSAPVTNSNPNPTVTPVPQQPPQQPTGTAPIFSAHVEPPTKPKDLPTPPPQQQAQNIFTTNAVPSQVQPKPKKPPPPTPIGAVKTLDEMVEKYNKLPHPVPQDQLMNRFQSLMIEGSLVSQQNSMREFLDKNPVFRPTVDNVDSLTQRTRSLEMIFAKAYLDHLKSTDSNIRILTPEQALQVKAIANVAANDPETTSMLKASAEQRVNAKVQALSTSGAQIPEPKPEGEKVNIAGDFAIPEKDKAKDNKGTTADTTRKRSGSMK